MKIGQGISGQAISGLLGMLLLAGCATGVRQSAVVRPATTASPNLPPALIPSRPSASINVNLSEQESLWHLRSALNVAALSCRTGKGSGVASSYNRMLSRHKAALAAANAAVLEIEIQATRLGPDANISHGPVPHWPSGWPERETRRHC